MRLCQEFPKKYLSPTHFYFGDIDCVFDIYTDAEIDLTCLIIRNQVEKEDYEKQAAEREADREAKQAQQNAQQQLKGHTEYKTIDQRGLPSNGNPHTE